MKSFREPDVGTPYIVVQRDDLPALEARNRVLLGEALDEADADRTTHREQLDQTAPMLAHARNATTVSGTFGMYAATRSPRPTPSRRSPAAQRATWSASSSQVTSASGCDSEAWTIATSPGRAAQNRCSA